jgi:hypothetical protein
MNKNTFLTAVASLAIAVAAPSAIAATSGAGVTPANGNDVVLPDGSVYQQNDDGSFSWVPNVATANAMGVDWNSLTQVDELSGPTADPFPSVLTLANPSFNRVGGLTVTPANGNDVILPDGTVYQGNDDGTYSWIPDVATATAMGLDWTTLNVVDELPGPVGTPFTSVTG